MQETITGIPSAEAGDALIAQDARYLLPRGGHVVYTGRRNGAPAGALYIAYPSAVVPRFLVPSWDRAAQQFVLRMLSVEAPVLGFCIRTLLWLPGGTALLCTVIFRDCIVLSHD